MEIPQLKPLSPSEWETLIDDYHHSPLRRHRWTNSGYSSLSLFTLSLSSLPRLPLSTKLNILTFLEHHLSLFPPFPLSLLLSPLSTSLSSPDPLSDQFLISVTSLFITLQDSNSPDYITALENLVNILLTVFNRPNHGIDRQTRAVSCECLRELERAQPCLLSGILGPLWGLCLAERTHCIQSYILLLTNVVFNVVKFRPNVTSLSTNGHIVPFSVPELSFGYEVGTEVRRVVSFLLECLGLLTSFGTMDFVSLMIEISVLMGLQGSLLKVQFSGLLYVMDPLMVHAYVTYLRLSEGFRVGATVDKVVRRVVAISKETSSNLVFRMLALHWLLGFVGKGCSVGKMVGGFYPGVFDPLGLKSLKIDLLAHCSISCGEEEGLFRDAIVSVLAFKWLPSWSTETGVSLRGFYKFLIGKSSHFNLDPDSIRTLIESLIFKTIQKLVVELTLEHKGLVPVYVSFIDRLLGCDKHRWLGERLLQTFDEKLLPKLNKDYKRMTSYFPIFEKIAENVTIPPHGLIDLLTYLVTFLVTKQGPDTALRTWSLGSKVLGICRIMLMHHHSSRLFLGLSRLLAFTCLYFPDLEVRDDARIYLRMLICVPGKKLRHILLSGHQLLGVTPSPQSSSYFNIQSEPFPDIIKSKTISSYIHLSRVIHLLVKESWSLSLSTLARKDLEPLIELPDEVEESNNNNNINNLQIDLAKDRIEYPQEPLRVMDSKVSEIVGSLRRHFSTIPDFRHMTGIKITVPCYLHFDSEPYGRVWGSESLIDGSEPAMYAIVLKFSSSAPYGSIPSQHIPFLPSKIDAKDHLNDSLDIVPLGGNTIKEDSNYKAHAFIELEPREPVPGLVYVSIEANTEDGQMIDGQLQGINIGIEDMFLKPVIPFDVSKDETPLYCLNLFNALWEACGSSANIAHETFLLKNGKGIAALNGTRSVKLVDVPFMYLIQCVEQYLSPFVVSVVGETLVDIAKDGKIIKDVVWKDFLDDVVSKGDIDKGPLYLKFNEEKEEREEGRVDVAYVSKKRNMGCFCILIFLPPRFHILLQMEVSDVSTLVRIRTDHWPCLAYIDDYLEALFSL